MIVTTTSGTYPWLFVTQIFHVGFQPSQGGRAQNFNSTTSRLVQYIKKIQKKNNPTSSGVLLDLVGNRHGIFVSQITTDMSRLS
jgi:hypothetical protein